VDERLVASYDYQLPSHLIAHRPASRRDAARLMVVRDAALQDRVFSDLPDLLHGGDVLVLNETRVIPARLRAVRASGGRVEILLLRPVLGEGYDPNARAWTALLRPSKRIRIGERLRFLDTNDEDLGFATLTRIRDDGVREVALALALPFEEFLERAGRLPLPPYVRNLTDEAQRRYQTVFARIPGSVAAPTAALHFTSELLETIVAKGVQVVKIALDVGLGTFSPMRGSSIDEHSIHDERYRISASAVESIARARAEGRRIVAVGTTVVRALEGNVVEHGALTPGVETTSLFITPGFRFNVVNALVTNFHLPRSTLLVLVSAFAGRERILRAYRAAIERGYRFFSFGDAMFLTPAEDTSKT
jgi:S-adenosylmethionine:tRNA ribosyltransferase-isomerase